MTKQDQFLYIIQTMAIAHGINMSLEDNAKEFRHEFSPSGVFILLDDAIYASERIPDELDAPRAANEFWAHRMDSEDSGATWFLRS